MLSDPRCPRRPPDALSAAVREIEAHAAESGWDRSASLYALVPTAELVVAEPALADALGLTADSRGFTPIDQELPADAVLEDALGQIMWPDGVVGCAAVVERLVLPPSADEHIPEDREAAASYAAEHPERAGSAHGRAPRCATGRRGAPTGCGATTTTTSGRHRPRPCARPPRVATSHPRLRPAGPRRTNEESTLNTPTKRPLRTCFAGDPA